MKNKNKAGYKKRGKQLRKLKRAALIAVSVCMCVVFGGGHIVSAKVIASQESDSTVASEAKKSTTDDDSIEFDYNGRKVVISPDSPVELASMEELEGKIREEDLTKNPAVSMPVADEDEINAMLNESGSDYDYQSSNYVSQPVYNNPSGSVEDSVQGIDVSHWDGDIDWAEVANAGYDFAMIKVCGRSIGDDGGLYSDSCYEKNIKGALNAGLKVGVYFFSQAITVQEAYEEASYILKLIDGYNITYPVAFDWETTSDYRTYDKLNSDELTKICEAFCDTIKSHGYRPMVYMSKNDWVNMVDADKLSSKYNVWLAWYFYKYFKTSERYEKNRYENGDELPDLDFTYNIWQYTSTGDVPGIDTYCDLNVSFGITHNPDSAGYGDVNHDGVFSSADAVAIKKYLAGIKVDDIDLAMCDVNLDGVVDSRDAVRILRKLAGYDVKLGAK